MNTKTLDRNRLILCREKLGITKQEAAKRLHLSQPAYLRYESGESSPSVHIIQMMAEIFGTSVSYLSNESNDPSPDCYLVKADTEPELFEFIHTYKNTDAQTRDRLLMYFSEFSKLKQR